MHFLSYILLALGLVILGGLVISGLRTKEDVVMQKSELEVKPPYVKLQCLFTPAEQHFLEALILSMESSNIDIFGKVRVADVIKVSGAKDKAAQRSAFLKISQKHFDYVLCEKVTTKILCVIELQDSSHNTASRKKRDEFIRAVCAAADLPLLEFPAQAKYDASEIREVILNLDK